MPFQEKQLGQSQGTGTGASIYSPAASTTTIVKHLTICNYSDKDSEFNIWLDTDGAVYNDTTVKFRKAKIKKYTTVMLDVFWPMNNSSGNLGISGAGCNFSVYGAEIT
jgi:hypothetical protein